MSQNCKAANIDTWQPADHADAGRMGLGLVRGIREYVGSLIREHRHRRAEADLLSMPDNLLKDIGIARSQVGFVVRFGRHRETL